MSEHTPHTYIGMIGEHDEWPGNLAHQYTPTDDEVREECVYGWQEVDMDGNVVVSIFEATDRFDRWLAAHDARVVEAAADNAEAIIADGDLAEVAAFAPGEVGRGAVISRRDELYEAPHDWLRAFAARIAAGDTDGC